MGGCLLSEPCHPEGLADGQMDPGPDCPREDNRVDEHNFQRENRT